MAKYDIGSKVEMKDYTKVATKCNQLGDRHIEKVDGNYKVVANPAPVPPTIEEQVAKLETETGLNRVMREIVLSENSGASDFVKGKAQEIEELAKSLRQESEKETENSIDKKD